MFYCFRINNPIQSFLEEFYDITNNKNDYIFCSTFIANLKEYLTNNSSQEFTINAINHILETNYNIPRMIRKNNSKRERAYIGLRRKIIESDDE